MDTLIIEYLIFAGVTFMGFLAIMNPLLGVPVFLALTSNEDKITIEKIAYQAVLTAFIIVIVFSLLGRFIMSFFGITFTALQLAGGIIISLIGYEMLRGKPSGFQTPSEKTIQKSMEEENVVAFTPLGTPLLAGPGVIITAMNFAAMGDIYLMITILSFGVLCVITYYSFKFGERIKAFVGYGVIKVTTRMMGLILNVLGIQILLQGVYSAVSEVSIS